MAAASSDHKNTPKIVELPRRCSGVKPNGESCRSYSMRDSVYCVLHRTSNTHKAALRKMLGSLVEPAIERLLELLDSTDEDVALKAIQVVLDRTGFGAKVTLSVEDESSVRAISDQQLFNELEKAKDQLRQLTTGAMAAAEPVIDGETTGVH